MAQQKIFQADQNDSDQVRALFELGHNLAQDNWGVTISTNPERAVMTTNAPQNIISAYLPVSV